MIDARDYFAAHCPDSELPKEVTEGDIIKAFNISDTGGNRLAPDFRRQATMKIRALARYAYADAMLEAGMETRKQEDTNEDN